ncbi:hypothetical protein BV900_07740 [Agrobacterium tumefaciens]|nr:hypothetical protein BV900_07740 [Agrobacterium tumefaciens]
MRIVFDVHVKGNRKFQLRDCICVGQESGRGAIRKTVVWIVVNEGLKSNSKVFVKFARKSLISAPRDI